MQIANWGIACVAVEIGRRCRSLAPLHLRPLPHGEHTNDQLASKRPTRLITPTTPHAPLPTLHALRPTPSPLPFSRRATAGGQSAADAGHTVRGPAGTEVEVQLEGARLGDAQGLLLYYPGIEVKHFEVNGGRPKARLAVAKDCRLSSCRGCEPPGISNLVTFNVGTLPQVDEIEPNNEFDKPQKSTSTRPSLVVENEDVDYFLVEAKRRAAHRRDRGFRWARRRRSLVAILDQRFVLASDDDTPWPGKTRLFRPRARGWRLPDPGPRELFGGSKQCRYRLHVGRFPRPLAVYPNGGSWAKRSRSAGSATPRASGRRS